MPRRKMNAVAARNYLAAMLRGHPGLPVVSGDRMRDSLRLAVKALDPRDDCARCEDYKAEIEALNEAFGLIAEPRILLDFGDGTRVAKAMLKERRRQGLEQQELAAILGVDPRKVSAWEREKRRPSWDDAVAWVRALGFDVVVKAPK